MDSIYIPTPKNPLDLIIPDLLQLNSTIRGTFTNTKVPEKYLQDSCLEYYLSKSFPKKTHTNDILDLIKIPKHIIICSSSDPEGFRELSERNMKIGYSFDDFDNKGNYLTVSFINKFNGSSHIFILAGEDTTEITDFPIGSHPNYFDFDNEEYFKKLEETGIKKIEPV